MQQSAGGSGRLNGQPQARVSMSPLRNQQGSSEGLRDRPVGQSLSRPATAPHDSGSFMGAVTNHLVDAIDATKPRRVVRVRPGTSGGSAQGMQHLLSRRMQTGNGAQGLRGWTSSKGQEIAAAGSCGGSLPTGWERYRLERSTGCLAHESTLPSAKPSLAAANHGKSRAQRPASEADQTKDTRESMVGSRFSGSEASEQVHGSDWENLPDEIASSVFSRLAGWDKADQAAGYTRLVCKRWADQLASFWPSLLLRWPPSGGSWGRKWVGLRSLRMGRMASKWTLQQVMELRHLYRLTSLDLGGSQQITDSSISALQSLTGLKSLNLSGCDDVTGKGIVFLAALTGLVALAMDGCKKVNGEALVHIHGLTCLQQLSARQCWQIGDEGVAMVAQLPSLTSLSLDGCMVTGRQGLPEMVGLKSLTLGSCRQLDALVLRQLTSLTHLSLARCVQSMAPLSRMVCLELEGCHRVTDAGLQAATQNMLGLSRLDLSGCQLITDNGLLSIHHLRNLTDLNLSGCSQVADTGLTSTRYLTALTKLNLSRCWAVTDQGLDSVATLPSLRHLTLSECAKVSENGIARLWMHTAMSSLELTDCPGVGDIGLLTLRSLSNLEHLSLAWSTRLTDRGMAVLRGVPDLKQLNLCGCKLLTDESLKLIGRCCRQLLGLCLQGCINISDGGLPSLTTLQKLAMLDLSWCRRISDTGLASLHSLQDLKRLDVSTCVRVTDDAVTHLLSFPRLKGLACSDSRITAEGKRRLQGHGIVLE